MYVCMYSILFRNEVCVYAFERITRKPRLNFYINMTLERIFKMPDWLKKKKKKYQIGSQEHTAVFITFL